MYVCAFNRIDGKVEEIIACLEAQSVRDDAKKVALLREGVLPKYSDLPASEGFENNMPAIEMSDFSDITDETALATRDLDLIDYGKALAGMPRPATNDPNPDFDYENYKGYHEEDDGLASSVSTWVWWILA